MDTILKLVSVGNSKGIRLPSRLLKRYGFSCDIQVRETAEGLLLSPLESEKPQLSWEETFMAMDHDNPMNHAETAAEMKAWQHALADGLEQETW